MSWGNPLLLLALVFPLLGAFALVRAARSRPPVRWPAMQRASVVAQRLGLRPARPVRPALLALVSIALAIVALAQPRWGDQAQQGFVHAREVMIALDLSRSMLAEDLEPTRLDRATAITEKFLDALGGARVGLIVFAGTAFVQVPLSSDYQIIREFLPNLDPDYMPQGGSDYAAMLDAALDGFTEQEDADRYLIVLSDGESSNERWADRLDALSERQVHVLALGLGTEAGGFIREGWTGYLQDENGDVILTKLQPATLQTLAKRTHGQYLDAHALDDVEPLLAQTVETGRKGLFGEDIGGTQRERFQWFLLPAVLIGFAALLREFRQRAQPRQIQRRRLRPEDRLPVQAAMSAVLFATLVPLTKADAHFDNMAGFEVRTVIDSDPQKRLRAIVEHLAEYDYDAFDLRLMVEETLNYGIDAQRNNIPPSEGAIRDAILATRHGESLDPSIADWSFYRARLEDLLPKDDSGEAGEENPDRKNQVMDEEDNPPTVTGQSTLQSATDSFGQGSATRTDATLGELSPSNEMPSRRREKREPPKSVKTASVSGSNSGGSNDADDPILQLSRNRMAEAVKNDSPGRLHQLLTEYSNETESEQFDW